MIPRFPSFKKIELGDRFAVDLIVNKYLPYSDFNFTSLWSWDINEKREISELNNNLVVLFSDYLTDKPFLSFIGGNKLNDTVHKIIQYAKISNLPTKLDLIGEEFVKGLKLNDLLVSEEDNDFDYIFSIPELTDLTGSKFKKKRQSAGKFLKEYPSATFAIQDICNLDTQKQILSLIQIWKTNKKHDSKNTNFEHEEIAIKRLLGSNLKKLTLSTIVINEKIISFSIDELLENNFVISHFIKADNNYVGIYEFMNKEIAEYFNKKGAIYWNWEQDLGIESLRNSKHSYRPARFLQKYSISYKG